MDRASTAPYKHSIGMSNTLGKGAKRPKERKGGNARVVPPTNTTLWIVISKLLCSPRREKFLQGSTGRSGLSVCAACPARPTWKFVYAMVPFVSPTIWGKKEKKKPEKETEVGQIFSLAQTSRCREWTGSKKR